MRFLVLLLLLASTPAFAQTARSAVYGELGGNAVIVSINYDYRVRPHLVVRAGLSVLPHSDEDGSDAGAVLAVPLMVGYLSAPMSNHHFEAGAGALIFGGDRVELTPSDDETFSGLAGTATIGYRYQRPDGGFVFRAGFTPVFAGDVLPWFGVSFGGSF